jgi:hypothetical protein
LDETIYHQSQGETMSDKDKALLVEPPRSFRGDTYNVGPTIPALFEAHERRYKKAQEVITELRAQLATAQCPVNSIEIPRALLEKWELYLSQGDMQPRWEIHNLLHGVAATKEET